MSAMKLRRATPTLDDAVDHAPGRTVAVAYAHTGFREKWLEHLAWLGKNIHVARWVRASEAAWTFRRLGSVMSAILLSASVPIIGKGNY